MKEQEGLTIHKNNYNYIYVLFQIKHLRTSVEIIYKQQQI